MRNNQLKRFINSDVVGQLNNGLFFEGYVLDKEGSASIFDRDSQTPCQIGATRVKWLAKAVRHC
jgi:hypothetical protein